MKKLNCKRLSCFILLLCTLCLIKPPLLAAASEEAPKIYGIGSVSKMFTAASIMKLAEQGKLELDTPVVTYLPEFQMADERYKEITVRMLLNHSSGLMGTLFHNGFLAGDSKENFHQLLLSHLKTQGLKAEPGEYGVYCNDGFTLAEIIIEKVSGMSFDTFVAKEFAKPLGMKHTVMPSPDLPSMNPSKLYYGNRELPYENVRHLASGGIYSTAKDLCTFSRIFFKDGNGILSAESIQAMASPEYRSNKICATEGYSSFGYGLGWDSVDAYPYSAYGIKALTKGGDTGNYHAGLTVLPDYNLSAAVVSSGGSGEQCQALAQQIILEVLKEQHLISDTLLEEKQISPMPIPGELKKFEGFYSSREMFYISFPDDNTLLLTSMENERELSQEYIYTKEGYFVSTKGNYLYIQGAASASGDMRGRTEFKFREESNGKTYMIGTTYLTLNGQLQTAITLPFAEKMNVNKISGSIADAWSERDGKRYYLTGEVYNSQYYLSDPQRTMETLKALPGYANAGGLFGNCRIIDENNAVCDFDLPVLLGRDLTDYHFYRKDEAEYLDLNGMTYMCEDAISSSEKLSGTLPSQGTGMWYQITNADSGKEISIKPPLTGAYYIYDKDDICTASSIFQDEKDTVFLPEDGKILLIASAGDIFQINR